MFMYFLQVSCHVMYTQAEFEHTEKEVVVQCGNFAKNKGCDLFLHGNHSVIQ